MMRSTFLAVVLLTMSLAPTARAGFTLTVPDVVLNEPPDADQVIGVELYFSEVTPDVRQKVAGWSVRADIHGGGPGIVRFGESRPNRVALTTREHFYFYMTAADSPYEQFPVARPEIPNNPDAYTSTTLIASGLANIGAEPPIVSGEGVLRLPVFVPAGATGVFPILLDPVITGFADELAEPIPGLILDNGSITIVPEPPSFAPFAIALAAMMRRLVSPAR
jgi:hypothetical protein